jgi:hypothetical protein
MKSRYQSLQKISAKDFSENVTSEWVYVKIVKLNKITVVIEYKQIKYLITTPKSIYGNKLKYLDRTLNQSLKIKAEPPNFILDTNDHRYLKLFTKKVTPSLNIKHDMYINNISFKKCLDNKHFFPAISFIIAEESVKLSHIEFIWYKRHKDTIPIKLIHLLATNKLNLNLDPKKLQPKVTEYDKMLMFRLYYSKTEDTLKSKLIQLYIIYLYFPNYKEWLNYSMWLASNDGEDLIDEEEAVSVINSIVKQLPWIENCLQYKQI